MASIWNPGIVLPVEFIAADAVTFLPAGVGAVARSMQSKGREVVSIADFGAVGDGVADDTAAVQAAVTYAASANREVRLFGVHLLSSTVTIPTSATGLAIVGENPRCALKFSGTGAMLSARSVGSFCLRNLTLVGPSSSINATAFFCDQVSSAVGTFYNHFADLTIEGFQVGLDISGLCQSSFENISMGLSKSGLFTGTDAQATPLIGLKIGTTNLACVFTNLLIFASQRCVQQSTGAQLSEGLYFFGCTFDLHFNTGTNSNQNAIYFESGQDVKFTSCWFTNSAKYPAAGYSDTLLTINHTPGGISAGCIGFSFNNCTFFGNGISVTMNGSADNQLTFSNNIVYLWSDLNNAKFNSCGQGLQVQNNIWKVVGTTAGAGVYDLVQEIVAFTSCNFGIFTDNIFMANRASVRTVTNGYVKVTGCNNFKSFSNTFPVQTTLTPGSEIVVSGGSDVVVIGEQQTQARQPSVTIAAGTYNGGNPTLASIVTGFSKLRMAIVEINLTLVSAASGGFLNVNAGDAIDQSISYSSGGTINIQATRMMLVSGTVNLTYASGGALTVSANSSKFKLTYI